MSFPYAGKRRKPQPRRSWIAFVAGGLLMLPLGAIIVGPLRKLTVNETDAPTISTDRYPYIVMRVVDDNTIVLMNGEHVRLIGVKAPETKHLHRRLEHFAKEAAAFTSRMVEGKRVRLEFEPANLRFGNKDRYGRTLAYVFLEDGTLLNSAIIREGYGLTMTRFPFGRMQEFRHLEREAREQQRGLWQSP